MSASKESLQGERLVAAAQIAEASFRAAERLQRRWELAAELMLVIVENQVSPTPQSAARRAVGYADALLAELERTRG